MFNVLKKTFFIFITLSIALAIFSSCEYNTNGKDEDLICFEDALGRQVSVEKNPKRVAALIGSFADVWMLAGGEICAAADDAWDDFGLTLDGAVNLGGAHSPSLELLVSAEPDLVIASASTASNVALLETLEAIGINIVYFDVDNFYDYLDMLDICTDITGRKDLYDRNGLKLQEKIEKIKIDYKNESTDINKKKVLILRSASAFVKAKGSEGTVLGEMLADMGCINIADNNKNLLENLSIEAILKEDPYHIFVVTMGNNTNAAIESLNKFIEQNPALNSLDAIKNNRLYIMEKKLYNLKPNSAWAEAYEGLYEKLKDE